MDNGDNSAVFAIFGVAVVVVVVVEVLAGVVGGIVVTVCASGDLIVDVVVAVELFTVSEHRRGDALSSCWRDGVEGGFESILFIELMMSSECFIQFSSLNSASPSVALPLSLSPLAENSFSQGLLPSTRSPELLICMFSYFMVPPL